MRIGQCGMKWASGVVGVDSALVPVLLTGRVNPAGAALPSKPTRSGFQASSVPTAQFSRGLCCRRATPDLAGNGGRSQPGRLTNASRLCFRPAGTLGPKACGNPVLRHPYPVRLQRQSRSMTPNTTSRPSSFCPALPRPFAQPAVLQSSASGRAHRPVRPDERAVPTWEELFGCR